MLTVRDRMTSPVETATPTMDAATALRRMYERKIRRLPVVDERGALVGIVTLRDVQEKAHGGTPVGAVMTPRPYTTSPQVPLALAAALLRDLGVGALPVIDRGRLVGIITESDIFDAFLELLGAARAGVRLVVPLGDPAQDIARMLRALEGLGVRVTGLTTVTDAGRPAVILTADEDDPRDLARALIRAGFEPSDISVQHTAA
jgi:acetoin utilization protein AcuB